MGSNENEIANQIIGCAIKVHRALGPGLLETSYSKCLAYELEKVGFQVEREKSLPLTYEEIEIDNGYRIDLMVEGKVIIEIKSVELVLDLHKAQLLTYLKLSSCKLGLLINFNVKMLRDGVKRVVRGL